jgi:hypothetical protein
LIFSFVTVCFHFFGGGNGMVTKLGEWLKLATKEEKEELARRAGTSVGYLRLLGYGVRENPKVRLALAISQGTWCMKLAGKRLPVVEVEELAAVPENSK